MAESTIITSQYVQIDQTPASVGDRIIARIIDMVILSVYLFVVGTVIGAAYMFIINYTSTQVSEPLFFTIFALFAIPAMFYSFLWETFNRGQSPGKKTRGIRVVMKDGSTPTMGAFLLRWLLLSIDFHMSYVGLIVMALTKNSQRLGDLAGGTLVIKENDYRKIHVSLDEFRHLSYNYRPVFPQAENLSLEQINLINNTLFRLDNERPYRIHELAGKVRNFLHINAAIPDEALLVTVTRDFQYYALEEI